MSNVARNLKGWLKQNPDHRDIELMLVRPEAAAALPVIADQRPACPAVYDQGNEGSCTAHAGGFLWHYEEQVVEVKTVERPSVAQIYYITRMLQGTTNQDSGATMRNVFKAIAKWGYCHDSLMPYKAGQYKMKPTVAAMKDAQKYIPQGSMYASVPQDLATIKATLAAMKPIAFGFSVPKSFMGQQVAKTGIFAGPMTNEQVVGGHAVALVGYEDPHGDGSGNAIVRNSWGADWGQAGYVKMPLSFILNPKWCSDFWTVSSARTGY